VWQQVAVSHAARTSLFTFAQRTVPNMICVSIGRGRHKQVIAEHRHLVEQGAQLVELRLDYLRNRVELGRLISDRPCPVVVTVRRERDGGRFHGDEDQRRTLLRSAIVAGVEYVDLEEDAAEAIPRYGRTKRIVSYHNFRNTPEELEGIHAHLASLDADVVKLATMANTPHDNLRMLQLVRQSQIPTVGICMGDLGTASRVLVGRFGAPFTYATFHQERALAPGQLSFQEMKEVYDYDRIRTDSEVYGVIGDPIAHSLSPLVHNAAFRAQNLNKIYVPFRIPRDNLAEFLHDGRELGLHGLSVTIPHKEMVLPALARYDGAVKGIGAANTIIFEGKENVGYNTDYRAAMDSLDAAMRSAGKSPEEVKSTTALILGAGGAAKAIAYGLVRRGALVVVTSRTLENAESLAKKLQCRSTEWERRHTVDADILVNCTPLGMHPNVEETPYEASAFKPGSIVFDTVYNPENTLFIKDARARNCRVVTGVDMFIRQAALQYKLFTGHEAPIEVMRTALKRATSAVKY
jgi:3-dehydroquinate dehydratase/shikimate dehydrogenase